MDGIRRWVVLAAVALGACSAGADAGRVTEPEARPSVDGSVSEAGPDPSVTPFVEHPGLPLNMLAGEPIDEGEGLVTTTGYEVMDLDRGRKAITGLPDGPLCSVSWFVGRAAITLTCSTSWVLRSITPSWRPGVSRTSSTLRPAPGGGGGGEAAPPRWDHPG